MLSFKEGFWLFTCSWMNTIGGMRWSSGMGELMPKLGYSFYHLSQ